MHYKGEVRQINVYLEQRNSKYIATSKHKQRIYHVVNKGFSVQKKQVVLLIRENVDRRDVENY